MEGGVGEYEGFGDDDESCLQVGDSVGETVVEGNGASLDESVDSVGELVIGIAAGGNVGLVVKLNDGATMLFVGC